jgi:hypothetical protein
MLTDTNTPQTTEQPKEDPRSYWAGFPEAPYSDSFKWIDDKGFEHLSTVRGWSFPAMLSSLQKAEQVILDTGGKPIISKENRPAPEAPKLEAPASQNPNEPRYVDPAELELKPGQHVFTVKEVFRDKNGDGSKYMLKVVLEEQYQYGNGKWGISYFKTDGAYAGWTKWELGKRFAPSREAGRVIVEDPKPGGKFANIVAFLPA